MRRTSHLSLILAVAAVLAIMAGCNKPSEESCRKAISNMRDLLGTDSATANIDVEGDIRRCKGGSSKKAVDCAAAAKTVEELRACAFMKVPAKKAAGSADPGSAAAPGSAADPGSAAGSN